VSAYNCLGDALDRWHTRHGYIVFRCSEHAWSEAQPRWVLPHAMHIDTAGRLTSYVPHGDLPHPLHALFPGFEGKVLDHDPAPAAPMPLRGILIGSWLLALGATCWAVSVLWRRWKAK
jgi:hypothetical protein